MKPLPVEVALAMVAVVVLAVPKFTTASMLALLVLSIRKYCVLYAPVVTILPCTAVVLPVMSVDGPVGINAVLIVRYLGLDRVPC